MTSVINTLSLALIILSFSALYPLEIEFQLSEFKSHRDLDHEKCWIFRSDLSEGFSAPFLLPYQNGRLIHHHKTYPVTSKTDRLEKEYRQVFYLPRIQDEISICAMAKGKVIHAETIDSSMFFTLRHAFMENGKFCELDIRYGPLKKVYVIPGQMVERSAPLGILHGFQLETTTMKTERTPFFFYEPEWYFRNYKDLTVPEKEKNILVVFKSSYTLNHYQNGTLKGSFEICLGQDPSGHKVKQGDNKTPEGEYRVTEMEKGPFIGGTGPWLGDRWMHISYPNLYDIHAGYFQGILRKDQFLSMESAVKNGKTANNYTQLGGRIGIHGWNGRFIADGTQNLTWGCVCMQNEDIIQLFEKIPMGTKVLILP